MNSCYQTFFRVSVGVDRRCRSDTSLEWRFSKVVQDWHVREAPAHVSALAPRKAPDNRESTVPLICLFGCSLKAFPAACRLRRPIYSAIQPMSNYYISKGQNGRKVASTNGLHCRSNREARRHTTPPPHSLYPLGNCPGSRRKIQGNGVLGSSNLAIKCSTRVFLQRNFTSKGDVLNEETLIFEPYIPPK